MYSLFSTMFEPHYTREQLLSGVSASTKSSTKSLDRNRRFAASQAQYEQHLNDIRTIGYTYLKPPGATKTMQTLVDEEAAADESIPDGARDYGFIADPSQTSQDHVLVVSEGPLEHSPDDQDIPMHIDLDASIQDASSDAEFEVPQSSWPAYDDWYNDETFQQQGFMPRSDPPDNSYSLANLSLRLPPPSPILAADTSIYHIDPSRSGASMVSAAEVDPFFSR